MRKKTIIQIKETVNVTPTWEAAVRIHMACLENPNATNEAKQGSRNDIIKLAQYVDGITKAHKAAGEANNE